jgi:hypothetical protein
MSTQFRGSKCDKVGFGLCILLAAVMGFCDLHIGWALLIGIVGAGLIHFLGYVAWVLLEEDHGFEEHTLLSDDSEFWDKAMPHLMEGRVVSGHRRPDGTIDRYVGDKPEDKEV